MNRSRPLAFLTRRPHFLVLVAALLLAPVFLRPGRTASIDPAQPATASVVLPGIAGEHRVVTVDAVTMTVQLVDATSHAALATVGLPAGASTPVDILNDTLQQSAWVVGKAGDIHVFNADTLQVSTVRTASSFDVYAADMDSLGSVYLLDAANARIWRIDLAQGGESATSAPADAVDLGVEKEGHFLAVTSSTPSSGTGAVHIFQASTLATLGSVPTAEGVGDASWTQGRCYVALNDPRANDQVLIVDVPGGVPTLSGTLRMSWGDLSLTTGIDSLVVYSDNSDALLVYEVATNPDSPVLLGQFICATEPPAPFGPGSELPGTGGSATGGTKGPDT